MKSILFTSLVFLSSLAQAQVASEGRSVVFLKGETINADKRPVEIIFTMVNDSGLSEGDDNGYTHGAKVVGIKRFKSGYSVALSYESDLYTRPNPVDQDVSINFVNDNMIRILFDNLQQGKLTYWKAGFGWHTIDSNQHAGWYNGSGQQKWFHESFNRFSDNIYIADGVPRQRSPEADGAFGVQANLKAGSIYSQTTSEVNGRLSDIPDASYYGGTVTQELIWKNKVADLSIKGGASVKVHDQGEEVTPYWGAGMATSRFEMGIRTTYTKGDAINYQRYNDENREEGGYDPTYMLELKFLFGKKR